MSAQIHPAKTEGYRIPLILFSGGLDSTHLLSERLLHSDVDVLYVNSCQGKEKVDMELAAREKIKKWMVKNRTYKIRTDFIRNNVQNAPDNHKFGQVMGWFNGAMEVSHYDYHSVVEMGYVSGDSISPDLVHIKQGWDYLGYVVKQRKVDLAFPLEFVRKQDIMAHMDPALYKLTWVCEFPALKKTKYHPCMRCSPCHTRQVEEFRMKLIESQKKPKVELTAAGEWQIKPKKE